MTGKESCGPVSLMNKLWANQIQRRIKDIPSKVNLTAKLMLICHD